MIGVGEIRLQVAGDSRLQRDNRHVDLVTIEESDPPVEVVLAEIGIEGALRELEDVSAQAGEVSPGSERPDQLLGPQVLVDVKRCHRRARFRGRGCRERRESRLRRSREAPRA